jgi:hypothetical protein
LVTELFRGSIVKTTSIAELLNPDSCCDWLARARNIARRLHARNSGITEVRAVDKVAEILFSNLTARPEIELKTRELEPMSALESLS